MLSFQETTTTTIAPIVVEVSENPWGIIVAVSAVVVAALVGRFTWQQGRAMRRIETREHEWQDRDRKSAHIRVTREQESWVETTPGRSTETSRRTQEWVRLKNTGLAVAREVGWHLDGYGETDYVTPFLEQGWGGGVLELHPGEFIDLYLTLSVADAPIGDFNVTWTDDNGTQSKSSPINL